MSGHVLYTASDFTKEEIERDNILAVQVIEHGLSICKVCGKAERELNWDCDTVLSCQGCHEDLSDRERDRRELFCKKCFMETLESFALDLMRTRPVWAGLGWVRYD
jgi:hypothetical protein